MREFILTRSDITVKSAPNNLSLDFYSIISNMPTANQKLTNKEDMPKIKSKTEIMPKKNFHETYVSLEEKYYHVSTELGMSPKFSRASCR